MELVERTEKRLQSMWDNYVSSVKVAARMRYLVDLVPFLATHGYTFSPENGTWFILDPAGSIVYLQSLPDEIVELLSLSIPGFMGNFGSLMPPYPLKGE